MELHLVYAVLQTGLDSDLFRHPITILLSSFYQIGSSSGINCSKADPHLVALVTNQQRWKESATSWPYQVKYRSFLYPCTDRYLLVVCNLANKSMIYITGSRTHFSAASRRASVTLNKNIDTSNFWRSGRESNPHCPDWKSGFLDQLEDRCIIHPTYVFITPRLFKKLQFP